MIPSREECYQLLRKYHFPEKKLRHVELVASAAKNLATKLKIKNEKLKINVDLIEAAALLHDIDKGIPGAGETHPKEGVAILRREGYEEVAELVAKHSLPAILDEEMKPKTLEEKILFLADKMVKNGVMGVDERFALWREENIPQLNEILDRTYPKVKELERELLGKIELKVRLFIAIDFLSKTKEQLEALVEKIKENEPTVRWEKSENLHLTLKFLGYVPEDKIRAIAEEIKMAAHGLEPFSLKFTQLGFFGHPKRSFIWLGIESGASLKKLVQRLETAMDSLGFSREKRPFAAHVTLGRVTRVGKRTLWQWGKTKVHIDPIKVDRIVLMHSKLTSRGSLYKLLNSFQLGR